MTGWSRSIFALLAAALAIPTMGACLDEEMTPYEASHSWNPAPPADDPPEGVAVVKGRIWVRMNPIVVPEDNALGGGSSVMVEVMHCGTEPVTVRDVRVEGSAALISDWDPGSADYPIRLTGGGFGFSIRYDPEVEGPTTAELVIDTAEATSPPVRVPIIYDPECDADFVFEPTTRPGEYPAYANDERGYLRVMPNPVRMRKSIPGSTVQVDLLHQNIGLVRISRILTLGPHVKIVQADGTLATGNALNEPIILTGGDYVPTVTLVYQPEQGQPVGDDTLVLGFDDDEGHEYELHVPILVR